MTPKTSLRLQPGLTAPHHATECGLEVIDHLNFNRGRIRFCLTENDSVGSYLYQAEKRSVRLQADAQNISKALEVIDFGGLFSGNAVGPSRSFSLRRTTTF